MRKIILSLLLIVFSPFCLAAGTTTHMLFARDAIPLLPDPNLQVLLNNNRDAYYVGADYPDTGYVPGSDYAEDSHYDNFIQAFIDHLRAKSSNPAHDFPAETAFMLGCATHVLSDGPWHAHLVTKMAANDFNNNYVWANLYADAGLDIIILIDKNLADIKPKNWYVPTEDLIQVYARMGKTHTAKEITEANTAYAKIPDAERTLALEFYPVIAAQMPWTMQNYVTDPEGGTNVITQQTAAYVYSVWQRLHGVTHNHVQPEKWDVKKYHGQLSTFHLK